VGTPLTWTYSSSNPTFVVEFTYSIGNSGITSDMFCHINSFAYVSSIMTTDENVFDKEITITPN